MDADYFQTSTLRLNALRNQLRAATAEQQSVLQIADQMQQMRHMVYAACEVRDSVRCHMLIGAAVDFAARPVAHEGSRCWRRCWIRRTRIRRCAWFTLPSSC
jgi:hypothetical protein